MKFSGAGGDRSLVAVLPDAATLEAAGELLQAGGLAVQDATLEEA